VCAFCADKIDEVDYKDIARLRRFLSERGKIEPRRKTGTCAAHQRTLNVALKRARHLALLPFTAEHIRVTGIVVREPSAGRGRFQRPPQEPPAEGGEAPREAAEPAAETTPEAPAEAPAAVTAEAPTEAPAEAASVGAGA
jgi:small subunit ribosomal protein S18